MAKFNSLSGLERSSEYIDLRIKELSNQLLITVHCTISKIVYRLLFLLISSSFSRWSYKRKKRSAMLMDIPWRIVQFSFKYFHFVQLN